MELYEIRKEIEKIVESNCKEIPYEGTEVDKQQMVIELYEFFLKHHTDGLKSLLKTIVDEDDEDHLSSLMHGVDNNQ